MEEQLAALQAQVQRTTDLETSAITLIQGLAQQVKDAADDPEQVKALADALSAKADALASVITDNTPAAPAPAPVEETPAPVVDVPVEETPAA